MQLKILIFLVLFFYEIIPISIVIRVWVTPEDKVKAIRLKYAITSILLIIINLLFTIYALVIADYNVFTNNSVYLLIPLALILLSIISYNAGVIKERYVVVQIGAEKIESTRFAKGRSKTRVNMISGIENVEDSSSKNNIKEDSEII